VALGAAHSMVAAASGQQMVSFDADSCLSSGHAAWLNSWVMGRSIHEAARFSLAPTRPQGACVHNGRDNDLGKTACNVRG